MRSPGRGYDLDLDGLLGRRRLLRLPHVRVQRVDDHRRGGDGEACPQEHATDHAAGALQARAAAVLELADHLVELILEVEGALVAEPGAARPHHLCMCKGKIRVWMRSSDYASPDVQDCQGGIGRESRRGRE